MNSKNSNKLQIRDYISIGIFSAILMVLYLVAAMTNVTPITYLIYSPATAFVGAIPYLFITTKIPKKGTVLLFAVVPFLYFLLLAGTEGMIVAAFFVVFAILAELILGNDRKNFKGLPFPILCLLCGMPLVVNLGCLQQLNLTLNMQRTLV